MKKTSEATFKREKKGTMCCGSEADEDKDKMDEMNERQKNGMRERRVCKVINLQLRLRGSHEVTSAMIMWIT